MTANLAALGTEPVLRNVLISAHAISAAVAFVLGGVLAVRRGTRPAQACAYVITLMLMTLFVAGAVILDWPGLDPVVRGLFTALIGLGGYTAWRGWRARAGLAAAGPAVPGTASPALASAIDDLGFTLITLFTGFVIILANDLGGPVWLLVLLGVFAVTAGRMLVSRIKARRLRLPASVRPPAEPGRAVAGP